MNQYPAHYSDTQGTEKTTIANDGTLLSIQIRGVEFAGNAFDSLEPLPGTGEEQLKLFRLYDGSLCACTIGCRMPIPIWDHGSEVSGELSIKLVLGDHALTPRGRPHQIGLHLVLEYGEHRIESAGRSGWFEDELLDLQRKLPAEVYIKACINCLYSDYSPCGHGLFGGMMCFRNIKEEYLKVIDKRTLWSVHGREERQVQETFLCSDFARRIPGTGYRG